MSNPLLTLANSAVLAGDPDLAREAIQATIPEGRPNFLLDLNHALNGNTITQVEVGPGNIHTGITFRTTKKVDGYTCLTFLCHPAYSEEHHVDIRITAITGIADVLGKEIVGFGHADHCYNAETNTQKGIYELYAADGSVMTIVVEAKGDVTPALRSNIEGFLDIECLFRGYPITWDYHAA